MSPMTTTCLTQLAAVASLATLLAGCGNGRASLPSAPSAPSAPTATAPVPGGPTFPVGPYMVSGAVTDALGPIAGANVNAYVITPSTGYSYMYVHGALRSDGAGQYQMKGLPAGAQVWFQVYKDGYVQQCAAPSAMIQGDVTRDLGLVAKGNVTASATQAAAPGLRWISGRIVEMTSAGKQPVAGVFVDFEPLDDFPAAITYSDTDGRFALCGLPLNDSVTLGVALGGRGAYATVPAGQTTGIEITLP